MNQSQIEMNSSARANGSVSVGILVRICFTMILLGYFLVWLPQPAVGLSFIGLDLGEWMKFIPEVRAGEVLPSRNFFYLPPVLLGCMIAIWTAGWSNNRWQTWAARTVAVVAGLLVFPALESFTDESLDQWLPRLAMLGLVVVFVILATFYSRRYSLPATVPWVYFIFLGLAGALLPAWTYLAIRPLVESLLATGVGFGPGLWLNLLGFMLLVVIGAWSLLWSDSKELK